MSETKLRVTLLNCVPEGKPPWLSYAAYRELDRLFQAVRLPSEEEVIFNIAYARLFTFLREQAGLQALPETEAAIHFNAFVLLRRGYQVEEITQAEYSRLAALLESAEQPARDDMDLFDVGAHRRLYDYLVNGLGVVVEPGRGPVWRRAKKLIENFEQTKFEASPNK